MTCDTWNMTHDMRQVTCDRWHATCGPIYDIRDRFNWEHKIFNQQLVERFARFCTSDMNCKNDTKLWFKSCWLSLMNLVCVSSYIKFWCEDAQTAFAFKSHFLGWLSMVFSWSSLMLFLQMSWSVEQGCEVLQALRADMFCCRGCF